jgi:peptidoglycan/LPS O-acetylase OafA/YrhL
VKTETLPSSTIYRMSQHAYGSSTYTHSDHIICGSRRNKLYETFCNYCSCLALFVLPSWYPAFLVGRSTITSPSHASPTSFLDGMRGYASLVVFVSHFAEPFRPAKELGYGYSDNTHLFQLPIIRLFHSGIPMVSIFFVVSGYALSYRPLALIRHGLWADLLDNMSSAIFRRGMRLFLPATISTFIVLLTIGLGIDDFSGYRTLPGFIEARPKHLANILEQFTDWARFVTLELMNPWSWRILDYRYDSHLWTIPIEFRASIVLFLVIIGLARTRTAVRFTLAAASFVYCMWFEKWEVSLFIGGMCMAEMQQIQLERGVLLIRRAWLAIFIWPTVIICGLFLLSFPIRHSAETPGFMMLSVLSSNYWNWHTYGAILVVWSASNCGILQKPFATPFAGYLGRISYAMYLVHGPTLHSVGYGIVSVIWEYLGPEHHQLGLVTSFVLIAPIVFWVADIFWRTVDEPSMRIAKVFYAKLSEQKV